MSMKLRIWVVAVLLVGVSTPAWAQPGPATLISPSADVAGSTIAFTWQSAPAATWYQFWLGKADATLVMDQWYTAEHAGCGGGATCSITLTPPISAGAYIWHIRTWGPSGYGPWSPAHMFTFRDVVQAWSGKLPPSRRFTLVLDAGAVLDNETGLVWQRTPSTATMTFTATQSACTLSSLASRAGWRVPSISELQTLLDLSGVSPALPPGHPFILPVSPGYYWSSTTSISAADNHYVINFSGTGQTTVSSSGAMIKVWCVRGGVGH
jgi:hypothetical protein